MIEDLLAKAKLANKQLIGIEIYKDFTSRIPRKEVEDHDKFVCRATQQIDEKPEAIIGGSYFRAAADSGDMDFIITKPDRSIDSLRYIFNEDGCSSPQQTGYVKASLAASSKDDGRKWHGATALPGSSIWRRIDFPNRVMGRDRRCTNLLLQE